MAGNKLESITDETYPVGSMWRKWDLHVHTPASIVQQYNAGSEDPWAKYLEELRALPAEYTVLGINDYWFLDGYSRVRAEFEAGNLPNLEEVFPVVEVRLDTLASQGNRALQKINLHFICDPTIPIGDLELELLGMFKPSLTYQDANGQDRKYTRVITRESMTEYGGLLRASTPESKLDPNVSDLQLGFNNMFLSFDQCLSIIEESSVLKDRVLTGVGRAEWQSMRWDSASSIKKKIAQEVDLLFTASPTRKDYETGKASLKREGISTPLVHCSDAHTWSESDTHNPLGSSLMWINSIPTFQGLRHALQESETRMSALERPERVARISKSPQNFFKSISINAADAELGETQFDVELSLNPGLVAIIGNKGQGKSALLDILALAANTDRQDSFSFLNAKRFRDPRSLQAARYVVRASWHDDVETERTLDCGFDPRSAARAEYLPQSLIEEICSADPSSNAHGRFEAEIQRVVFRHIPEGIRQSHQSLASLISSRTSITQSDLESARREIHQACDEIATSEARILELESMDVPGRIAAIQLRIQTLENDLALAEAAIAAESGLDVHQAQELSEVTTGVLTLSALLEEKNTFRQSVTERIRKVAETLGVLAELQRTIDDKMSDLADQLSATEPLYEWTLRDDVIEGWIDSQEELLKKHSEWELGARQLCTAVESRKTELEALDAASSSQLATIRYERDDLRDRLKQARGPESDPSTLAGLLALSAELATARSSLAAAQAQRRESFARAHAQLLDISREYHAAYSHAQDFASKIDIDEADCIVFDARLRVSGFLDAWTELVNRQKLRQFDIDQSDFDGSIFNTVNLSDPDELLEAVEGVDDRLRRVRGADDGAERPLAEVLRGHATAGALLAALYDLSWLEAEHVVQYDGRDLQQLSPGQRGLVLMLMYLIIDTSQSPLLLDQPEENLDNETIRNSLVPALKLAAGRRQVLVVTHNPNLAVVGDADQVVVARQVSGRFTYRGGALATRHVGRQTVDVLEGTYDAFENRRKKYRDVLNITAR